MPARRQSTKRSIAAILAILLAGSRGVPALSPARFLRRSSKSCSLLAGCIINGCRRRWSSTECRAVGTPTIPDATSSSIIDEQVELSNGISMQLMASFPAKGHGDNTATVVDKPVLLFLHGSFHGAWCWAEHFLPYFAQQLGYPTVALSWRGTGGTFAGNDVKKVKLLEHVDDLRCLLSGPLRAFIDRHAPTTIQNSSPVLICHSFGGLAVMKYLEIYCDNDPSVRGAVTICSVPPSGNGKVTLRYLRRSPLASWKITAGFALKKCLTDGDLCRTLFFGGPKRETILNDGSSSMIDHGVSDEDIRRYQSYFARDSAATIDIMDLSRRLPSRSTNANGGALFLDRLHDMPFLVAGASDDFIVDKEALEETATYFGVGNGGSMPVLIDSPHDVMLGPKWMNAANVLKEWLALTYSATKSPSKG
jgi:pimeloyl-ACP methyl ester carboxylesterase